MRRHWRSDSIHPTQARLLSPRRSLPSGFPGREGILKVVKGALEKYLEQPHLLDPHLEDMMTVVMGRAKELVVEREEHLLAESGGGSRGRPGEAFPFQASCTGATAAGAVCFFCNMLAALIFPQPWVLT